MFKFRLLVWMLFLLLLAAACAPSVSNEEPAVLEETRPQATAVPAVPTVLATETPSKIEPEADTLGQFVEELQTAVTNQDYAQMEAVMSDPIGVGGWRSEWRMYAPDKMIAEFQNGALPAPVAVQFSGLSDDEITALIGQPPASMLGPNTNVVAVLHSSGWGQSSADDAILFVAEEAGQYTWQAFLYTNGRFADPDIGSVSAPVGLIYRAAGDGIYQIQLDGSHRQLFDEQTANIPNLVVAPDGRHAAYLSNERELWLIDSVTGNQQQLAADFTLSDYLDWGNSNNLITGVWLDPNEADGPNNGHISLVNIAAGSLQILDEERLSGNRPAYLINYDRVAFDVFPASAEDVMNGRLYHPDSGLQPFDQGEFSAINEMINGPLFNPAWSPLANQLSWLVTAGERFAVQVFDLDVKTAVQIFDWDPARFGGLFPSPAWSPDERWLALDVLANGPEGSGIWLLAADGRSQTLVDAQGHDPYWVNDFQLVFNVNGSARLHDINSGETFRLDLPPDSSVLGYTNPDSLTDGMESIDVAETDVRYVQMMQDVPLLNGPGEEYEELGSIFDGQTALVTGSSLDGQWWRVICPDDSVGDCWVTADPAFTLPSNSPDPQSALPDPATLSMANEVRLPSPDDRWQATAAWSMPVNVADQEKYYAFLTVTDGDVVWKPIAEWRNYGLGYTWPSIVQWSTNGGALYYTNSVSPDGCAVFANGTDLYRLDVVDGRVTELIPPGMTMNFALTPDETAVAYTYFADGQYSLVVQDLATGAEQSAIITETGQGAHPGNIVWSPDGTQVFLVVAYDACSSAPTHSILDIDVETMMATTLIEQDGRQFSILDVPDLEKNEIRLLDKDAQTWRLDINSGELVQENE